MIVFTRHFKGHLEIALSAILYQYWHCYCHFKNFIFLLRNFLKKCNISVQYTSVFFLRLSYLAPVSLRYNSSVMRQRANLKTGVSRKQSTQNFPKNEHFLLPNTDTYVCVSVFKKCLFFGKFGVLCFLETPFWDSPFCLITDELLISPPFPIYPPETPVDVPKRKGVWTFGLVFRKMCCSENIWKLSSKTYMYESF